MAYKVLIKSGGATSGSTPLKDKYSVSRWVKRTPLGNKYTKVKVENTITKKELTASKIHFYNPKWWSV